MKSVIVLFVMFLIPSIYIKNMLEVDYYVEEQQDIKKFSVDEYFGGSKFEFQQYGFNNEFIGLNEDCVIIVGASNRDGNSDAVFEAAHRGDGTRILYLYKNLISVSAPYFQAQFDHYIEMLKVALGDKPTFNLMLHIAAQNSCRPHHFAPLKLDISATDAPGV